MMNDADVTCDICEKEQLGVGICMRCRIEWQERKRNSTCWEELCKVYDSDNSPLKERAQKMFLAFVRLRYHQVEEQEC